MAQQRQLGMERIGVRGRHDLYDANGALDHMTVGVYAPTHKQPQLRRSMLVDWTRKLTAGLILVFLFIVLGVTVVAYYYLSLDDELNKDNDETDYLKNDYDFLINVPRIERSRVLEFGNVSVDHGRDSRDSCGVLMLSWIQMWDAIERDNGYTMPYHSEKVLSIHRTTFS